MGKHTTTPAMPDCAFSRVWGIRNQTPRSAVLLALPCLLLTAATARAAGLYYDPSLLVRETITDNANFGVGPVAARDDITELMPSLVVRSIGENLTLDGRLSADGIDYRYRTEPNRVLPNGGISGELQAFDGHFLLDAAAMAGQNLDSIFLANSAAATSYNTFTTGNFRLGPAIKGQLPGGATYTLRADDSLIRGFGGTASGAPGVDTNLARGTLDVDALPRPLGWTVHGQTSETSYQTGQVPISRESLGRVILKGQMEGQLVLDVRGGVEHENFLSDEATHALEGAGLTWQPSPRTKVDVQAEHRFFGTYWDYGARHSTPNIGINLTGSQDVLTTAEVIFSQPSLGHDMAALLDAMLMESVPDPIERARAVQELMVQQSLPEANASAAQTYEPTPMRVASHRGVLTWLGREDAVDVSYYEVRMRLPYLISSAFVPAGFTGENLQRGTSLTVIHHLGPFTNVSVTGGEHRVDGLGATNGQYTRGDALTLQLNRRFATHTDFFLGGRLQAVEFSALPATREKAGFLGASHHF